MPNKKSAIKRMRSDERKAERNANALSDLRTRRKKITQLVKSDPTAAKEQARIFVAKLDKAAGHGVIPRARADRNKARIAKLLSKQSA